MGWTRGTTGTFTKSADTNRDAYISSTPLVANGIIRSQHAKPADEVRLVCFSSWDGRSCYEIGLDGVNIKINQVVFVTTITNHGSAAHGLAANTPFTMDVRVENRTISVYLNGSTVAALSYTVSDSDALVNYRAYGFVSSKSGATLLSCKVGELVPSVESRPRGLWWVAGGILYVSFDARQAREVARGVCKETGNVRLVEFKSKIYVVDGQKAREVNPVTFTVTEWVATDGQIPGSGGTSGVTDLYLLTAHWSRLQGVSLADPTNLQASALDNQYDWDTGSENPGRAFTLVDSQSGRSGQVIRGILSSSNNVLNVAGVSKFYELYSDPTRGSVLFDKKSDTVGVSGPDSMLQADADFVVFHGPQGFYKKVGSGGPEPISDGVLSKYIQFPESDRELYTVTLTRDTVRKGILLCMSRGDDSDVHFWYDERVGGFQNGQGGFFPITFPSAKRPTATIFYDGQLILGCTDGYIRFADDAADDDDGTPIVSYAALERIDPP